MHKTSDFVTCHPSVRTYESVRFFIISLSKKTLEKLEKRKKMRGGKKGTYGIFAWTVKRMSTLLFSA